MASIRVPNRARSSSTLACPLSSSLTTSSASPSLSSTSTLSFPPSSSSTLSILPSASTLPSRSSTPISSNSSIAVLIREPKVRRPSLPIIPASMSHAPGQKSSCGGASLNNHLYPTKETSMTRPNTAQGISRTGAFDNGSSSVNSRNDRGRITSSTLATRTHSYSTSPSPRLGSSSMGRFGDSSTGGSGTTHPLSRPSLSLPCSSNSSSASSSPSLIAKPMTAPRQKTTAIKPPSIITKPSSGNGKMQPPDGTAITIGVAPKLRAPAVAGTLVETQKSSVSPPSSTCVASPKHSLPPIAPPPNPLSAQIPQAISPSGTFSAASPSTASLGLPGSASTTSSPHAPPPSSSFSPSVSPLSWSLVRSKNRLQAGVDSGCFMVRSASSESLVTESTASISSSVSSTPTLAVAPTITTPTRAGTEAGSVAGTAPPPISKTSSSSMHHVHQQRPKSRRPSTSDLCDAPSFGPLRRSMPVSTAGQAKESCSDSIQHLMQASNMSAQQEAASALTNIVRCQCPPPPPPLEFPENVKREMQLIDAEHRGRECELYSKIIELQIENANLKGDKEALKGILSHRDKMLVELQTQLQIMEYVCRENDVKVDIELCPDEAFQNWSFKESDEVYQRIILTTQDMLRTGHKCIQENTVTSRSSAHNSLPRRSSWAMSNMAGSAGLGIHRGTVNHDQGAAGTQGINIQDQGSDSSVPTKKISHQQGASKADKQRLLQLEQVFQVTGKSSSSIVSHANLAKIDAGVVENNGRRALDCGDDRSSVFRTSTDDYCYTGEDFIDEIGRSHADSDASGDDVDGDDDDEGQESEFEELGEDMIKYVELESSVGPPRRDSRSSSFSKMGGSSPYGGVSAIGTPDMSTAVLMKNLWAHKSSNGARQSASTTPLQHPFHCQQQQQHYSQPHFRYGATASGNRRRVSGGSSVSCSSLIDDYFMQGQQDLVDTTKITAVAGPMQHGQPTTAAPIVIGLGLSGIFPPAPLPTSSSSSSSSSFASSSPFYAPVHTATCMTRSPLSNCSSATFSSNGHDYNTAAGSNSGALILPLPPLPPPPPPPPMMPLPPLPTGYPRFSYREHTKQKLLECKRPTHGRISSHGFVIENVGLFLKRRTYGKTLTRDRMHRGLRRRDSV